MVGNDLMVYRQMQAYRDSLLSEAERMRFATEAQRIAKRRRASGVRSGDHLTGIRRTDALPISGRGWRAALSRLVRPIRYGAARAGSALVALGRALETLDERPPRLTRP